MRLPLLSSAPLKRELSAEGDSCAGRCGWPAEYHACQLQEMVPQTRWWAERPRELQLVDDDGGLQHCTWCAAVKSGSRAAATEALLLPLPFLDGVLCFGWRATRTRPFHAMDARLFVDTSRRILEWVNLQKW